MNAVFCCFFPVIALEFIGSGSSSVGLLHWDAVEFESGYYSEGILLIFFLIFIYFYLFIFLCVCV